ncbi:MAG: zinc ABC transporter substrate-binding protein [Solobacterium sp.]|nr:zinc ABC transporter substrate-binding protein [Solobacterium sp.]
MKLKRILTSVLCIMLSLTAAGCAAVRTKITYTVYPLQYLIERLSGSEISYESIQQGNTLVQRAQIRSDYETVLDNSAVFFHIGSLEPYLSVYDRTISSNGVYSYDLSGINAVYDFKRYTRVINESGEVSFTESSYYDSPLFDLVDMDKKDLNLWTDPIVMYSMAKNIHEWLVRNYPERETVFSANLQKLENDLIELDAKYQALSTSLVRERKSIRFVSMTASFGNWQKTYGFEVYPVILSKYGILPNEQQLAVIMDRIRQDGVRYIVYEPNMTPDMIALFDRLQSELGLNRVELSNLSSLSDHESQMGQDYLSVMYENLATLETMKEDISQ